MKYNKFDLMWEATRRNEDYRAQYYSGLEKYPEGIYSDEHGTPKHLANIQSSRWDILIIKESKAKIKLFGWVNPDIGIAEIKDEIRSGADPLSVHPYAFMNPLTRTDPNIYYHEWKEENPKENHYFSKKEIDGVTYVCIREDRIRKRMLVLINPESTDKSIIENIKITKNEVLKFKREMIDALKKDGVMTFYPRDIGKYMEWLKKYDEIVAYFKQTEGNDSLTVEDGVFIVPAYFSFVDVVPDDTPKDKFEGQRKAYRDAYNGAIQLIRYTPHIPFSSPKTESNNNK